MQWKALPKEVKDRYEERARAIALDSAAKKISETSTSETAPLGGDSRSISPHSNSYFSASGISPDSLTLYFSFGFSYFTHLISLLFLKSFSYLV